MGHTRPARSGFSDNGIRQEPHPRHLHVHRVARLEGPHAGRRSGRDEGPRNGPPRRIRNYRARELESGISETDLDPGDPSPDPTDSPPDPA